MSRERRPGLGGVSARTTGRSTGGLGAPGKRTLTQGLVQRKARAAATMDPPPVYEESRATIDLGGGGAASSVGAGEVGHGGASAGREPATIDAPAAWDESLGRPTIATSGGAAGEGAEEVAAEGDAEPGWVQRARAFHEAHAAVAEAFDRLTWGACVGEDGALDPRKVARWQAEHGVAPDGRVGDATLDAARASGGGAGAGASGGGDRAATSEPVSIDAPARYDEVDRGTLAVGEAGGPGAAVAAGGGDRGATSEPVSIDAPARYDEVDRGTLEVGGAVQRRATQAGSAEGTGDPVAVAAAGVEGAAAPLPHLDAIQASFGPHDVTGVRAQVGGAGAAASDALGAEAYATGDRVAFAASPSLHTAAHEAAHVVQQRAGVQLEGGVGQVGDAYEQHADAVADAVVRGESAAGLLGQVRGAPGEEARVQRKEEPGAGDARARRGIDHLLGLLDLLETYMQAPGGVAIASTSAELESVADTAMTVAALVEQHGAGLSDSTWQRFDEVMRRTDVLAGRLLRDATELVRKARVRLANAAVSHGHKISYEATPRSDVAPSTADEHGEQLRAIVEAVEARVAAARGAMGGDNERAVLTEVATSVAGMLRQGRRHVAAAATGSRMALYAEVVDRLEPPLVDLFTWGRKAGAPLQETGLGAVFDIADELRFDVGLSKLDRSEAYYADQKPPGGADDGDELVKKLISVWKDRAMLSELLGYAQLETMLSEPPPAPDPDLMTTLLKTFAQSVITFASGPLAELVQLGLGVHAVESAGGDMAKAAVGHLTSAIRGMATGALTEPDASGSPKTRFFELIRQGMVHKISMAGASLIDIEPQLRRLPPGVLQEMFDWMKDKDAFASLWDDIIGRVVSEWINFCAAARHGVSDPEQARHLTLDADHRDGETVGGTLERVSNRDALVNVQVHVRESEEGPVLRLGDVSIPAATDKMVTTLRDAKTPLARLGMHRWIHLLPSGGQIYLDASHAVDLGWARRGFLARIGREEGAAGRGTFGEVIEQSDHASDQDVQAGVDRVLELLQRATTAKLQGA